MLLSCQRIQPYAVPGCQLACTVPTSTHVRLTHAVCLAEPLLHAVHVRQGPGAGRPGARSAAGVLSTGDTVISTGRLQTLRHFVNCSAGSWYGFMTSPLSTKLSMMLAGPAGVHRAHGHQGRPGADVRLSLQGRGGCRESAVPLWRAKLPWLTQLDMSGRIAC